jgi:hypothetical protein
MSITLADAIESLRTDLRTALLKAEPDIVFTPGPIELELIVTFANETSAGGGIKAYIFEASGNVKGSQESSHRVKLTLSATDEKGGPLKLTSKDLPANLPNSTKAR